MRAEVSYASKFDVVLFVQRSQGRCDDDAVQLKIENSGAEKANVRKKEFACVEY